MATWENTTVTQNGQNLLNGLIAGNKKMTITRAVAGTSTVPITELILQTDVKDQAQTAELGNVQIHEDHVVIPVIISNIGLATGYTAKQVGVYAQAEGEAEILFFLAQSTVGQAVPSQTDSPHGFTAEFHFTIAVSNASELNITVNTNGILTQALADERYLKLEDVEDIGGGMSAEPVMWEKGVNINDLGPGYFCLDAKLEEGDAAAMGLPEKYGAEWVGMYVVIKGSEDIYHCEAYLHDWYNDILWHAILGSDITWVTALPLTGGTLEGDLTIKKDYPRLELENTDAGRSLAFLESDSYAQIVNYLNATNYRGIRIKPETAELESSVVVHEIVGGAVNNYKLYGEHNITRGSTDIEAGVSALKTGCIHLVHE